MDYRDEDPRNDVDYQDNFDSFLKTITGREDGDDLDFYEPRPILPVPTQEDLDYEKAQKPLNIRSRLITLLKLRLICTAKTKRSVLRCMPCTALR